MVLSIRRYVVVRQVFFLCSGSGSWHRQPGSADAGQRWRAGSQLFRFVGAIGYDKDGKLLWSKRLGPYKNDFGAGSSPILAGDRVILCQDHDLDAHIVAYDKRIGEELWKADRSVAHRNYCTPVVWNENGRQTVVVAGRRKSRAAILRTAKSNGAWEAFRGRSA